MMASQDHLFRRARRADLEAIIALLADDDLGASREDPRPPLAPAYVSAFDAIDADPNQLLVVAEAEGEIVATLQVTFVPGLARSGAMRGQIEAVRVRRDRRASGLGKPCFAGRSRRAGTRAARSFSSPPTKRAPTRIAFTIVSGSSPRMRAIS